MGESVTTPAGWYPDPSGVPGQRYWDGQQWTGHAPPAAPAPKTGMTRSAKIVATAGVVIAVVGFVVVSINEADDGARTPTAAESSAGNSASGVVGSEVRDGKFAFVVSSVERQTNWYGDPKPRGEWVIATIQVTNVSAEPQSFFVANQKLIDSAGREYAADGTAAIYMDQESMALDLGPGLSLTVKVPFDLPKGATLSELVLHDSAFSGGARVAV